MMARSSHPDEAMKRMRLTGLDRRGRTVALLSLIVGLLVATAAAAQIRGFRGGRLSVPLREGLPELRTGFMFCRLLYTSVRSEAGGYGWATDYPAGDHNLMTRLPELTGMPVSRWSDGEPGYAVVRATDPRLFQCPFLFASDIGTAEFNPDETQRLREYLAKGGFFWVDDFWGERAWYEWVRQIEQILPGLPIVELTPEHPLFSVFYQVPKVPQIPSIRFWRVSGGGSSERGAESAVPHLRAIFDHKGQMLVLMSHNTDIADGWEREGEDEDFFYAFSGRAYAMGVNVAVWAMSH